jgi:hypothetical protein
MQTPKQRKLSRRIALAVLALIILFPSANSALAVEGGIGRPISGASINPYAGLIPPAPGFTLAIAEQYYTGPISGAIPIGNFNLNLGLDMKASFTPVSVVYIWPTPWKEVNFASVVAFPISYVEVKARVTLGPLGREVKDNNFGLFDLFFTPIIASYHISKTDHIALGFSFWAPTGDYDPNRLAVLSTNTWTFVPTLTYTKIFPAANIELSGYWGLTFDTENPATHYQNGVLSDLEATAIKRFKFGGGLGVIGSWIQQLNDDTGPTADRVHGFSGRAFGVGPILTYSTELGKHHLDFNARWVHEFDNRKRPEGDLLAFNASFTF